MSGLFDPKDDSLVQIEQTVIFYRLRYKAASAERDSENLPIKDLFLLARSGIKLRVVGQRSRLSASSTSPCSAQYNCFVGVVELASGRCTDPIKRKTRRRSRMLRSVKRVLA